MLSGVRVFGREILRFQLYSELSTSDAGRTPRAVKSCVMTKAAGLKPRNSTVHPVVAGLSSWVDDRWSCQRAFNFGFAVRFAIIV